MELITKELLREWGACTDGFKKFVELFPDGATLEDAMAGLDASGDGFGSDHDDWSLWLFNKSRNAKMFEAVTATGYRNSGNSNSGNSNSGNWNSGYRNSGNRNSGDWNSGDWNSGYSNSGNWNSGNWNSGYRNSGNRNSGDWNSGDWNSGYSNSGNWNSGNSNSGYRNSGDWNSGYRNSGDWNSGNSNSGYRNSGDWNSGNWNSGYFNSETPNEISVFNKPCKREVFDSYDKPAFLYFDLTYWVYESDMTDEDKKADTDFYVRGGQLRTRNYKEAFKESWNKHPLEDNLRIKDCPNFDADVFFEISGIDLRD